MVLLVMLHTAARPLCTAVFDVYLYEVMLAMLWICA